jgi:small subunit ribosomal protein S12
MTTFQQLYKTPRTLKKRSSTVPALRNCPQKKCIVIKALTRTPRKPNSAIRKIAKVSVLSTKKSFFSYIPGEGHNLQQYSTVLIRGGGAKDLPGVKYHLIRGVWDFLGLVSRKNARSKYGIKKTT